MCGPAKQPVKFVPRHSLEVSNRCQVPCNTCIEKNTGLATLRASVVASERAVELARVEHKIGSAADEFPILPYHLIVTFFSRHFDVCSYPHEPMPQLPQRLNKAGRPVTTRLRLLIKAFMCLCTRAYLFLAFVLWNGGSLFFVRWRKPAPPTGAFLLHRSK